MEKRKILGTKIKEARKSLNMSQDDLAGDDFTKSYISKIERGLVNPSMKALEIISSRLNLSIAYFINEMSDGSYDPRLQLKAQKNYELGNYKECVDKYNEALAYKEHIEPEQLVRIYFYISDACLRLGEYERCLQYCNEARELMEASESIFTVKLYLVMGEAYYYLNKRQDSLDTFLYAEKLLNEYSVDIDIVTKLELYNDIAILYSQVGQTQLSKDYFKTIIEMSKKEKIITHTLLSAFSGLAQISVIYERDADKSLSYLNNDVLSLYKFFEDYVRLGGIYVKFASAYYEKDDLDKFKEYIDKLQETLPLIDDVKSKNELEIYVVLFKGKLANREGRFEQAEALMLTALNLTEQYDELIAGTSVYLNMGSLYMNMNKLDLALEYLLKCERLSNELQFSIRLPELYQLMGKTYIKLGDAEKAQEYYDKAFKLLRKN